MINAATHPLDDSTDLDTGKLIAKSPISKIELTLLCLLRVSTHGMNQPEAHNAYGESCLHSSVSALQNNYGIKIFRRSEPWKHRHGGRTHFHRYRLMDNIAELYALSLLNKIRNRRGMASIIAGEYFHLPNKSL